MQCQLPHHHLRIDSLRFTCLAYTDFSWVTCLQQANLSFFTWMQFPGSEKEQVSVHKGTAYITSSGVPSVKTSHMTKPKVNVGGDYPRACVQRVMVKKKKEGGGLYGMIG